MRTTEKRVRKIHTLTNNERVKEREREREREREIEREREMGIENLEKARTMDI